MFFNFSLESAILSILLCQSLKLPLTYYFHKEFTPAVMTSTGGMPSSHSAGVTALITALVFQYGWSSPYTAIATVFGVIVIFDSMGVRRQSGEHGILLNELMKDFRELQDIISKIGSTDYQVVSEGREQIKEYLGHKPREVVGGVLAGIIFTTIFYHII